MLVPGAADVVTNRDAVFHYQRRHVSAIGYGFRDVNGASFVSTSSMVIGQNCFQLVQTIFDQHFLKFVRCYGWGFPDECPRFFWVY